MNYYLTEVDDARDDFGLGRPCYGKTESLIEETSIMHYLNETHILIFLVQVVLLLGLARGLGEVFRRWGQPSITGEIVAASPYGPCSQA